MFRRICCYELQWNRYEWRWNDCENLFKVCQTQVFAQRLHFFFFLQLNGPLDVLISLLLPQTSEIDQVRILLYFNTSHLHAYLNTKSFKKQ